MVQLMRIPCLSVLHVLHHLGMGKKGMSVAGPSNVHTDDPCVAPCWGSRDNIPSIVLEDRLRLFQSCHARFPSHPCNHIHREVVCTDVEASSCTIVNMLRDGEGCCKTVHSTTCEVQRALLAGRALGKKG